MDGLDGLLTTLDASEICVVSLLLQPSGDDGRTVIFEEMMRSSMALDIADWSAMSFEVLTSLLREQRN